MRLIVFFLLLFIVSCDGLKDISKSEVSDRTQAPFFPSNSSLYYDGTTNTLSSINAQDLLTSSPQTAFTVSFWFKTNEEKANLTGSIFSASFRFDRWSINLSPSGWEFVIVDAINTLSVQSSINNLNQWQHCIFVYYNDTNPYKMNGEIYINGELVSANSFSARGEIDFLPTDTLGFVQDPTSEFYLDEFLFWNRRLTSDEVKTVYNSGKIADIETLINDYLLWYRFGEDGDNSGQFLEHKNRLDLNYMSGFLLVEDNPFPLLEDPLSGGGDKDAGSDSGSGSGPFIGGSDGYGGDYGDGGENGGDFP